MTSYELGYQVGQAFGYLLAAGLLFYFLYWRKRNSHSASKKNEKDEPLDKI